MDGLYMGISIPEVERQKASKALNCNRLCPLWVKSGQTIPRQIRFVQTQTFPHLSNHLAADARSDQMSALGQKRTNRPGPKLGFVRCCPKADKRRCD